MTFNRRQFLITTTAAVTSVSLSHPMLKAHATSDPRADATFLNSKIKHIDDADLFASLDFSPPDYTAWSTHWSKLANERALFRDIDDFLTSRDEATNTFTNGKPTVLALADEVVRHNIKGWGPVAIQHGPVVDFNADYGQSGKYGFHYWGFARPLIQAFLLTNDQKYLDEFESLFNAWYDQRDKVVGGFPHLDVIYYELGLGVRNRLFLEYYFLSHDKRTPQTHERLLKTFLGAARWLYEELKLGYRPHNWQMIGAFGLAHIAALLREFRESRLWLDLATQRMLEHLAQDFFPDGCFSERCPSSYNIIAYRDPRNLGVLLSRDPSTRALAVKLTPQLDAQVHFLTNVVAPDGYLPGINDGARAPLLRSISPSSRSPGIPGEGRGEGSSASTHFASSGFTILRSGFSPDAHYMLINHGPYGGGHSHADTLSFELHALGQALAIDSGLGDTYDDPVWSSWYVHAKAHNMLTIDLENPDRAASVGTDVTWTSDNRYDHFAATHRGYETSKGIVHRRHVLFVKPDYFVIYDRVDARGAKQEHSLEWNLHPTVALDKPTGPGLIVIPSDDWPQKSEPAWAGVGGIAGFENKQQAQIEWLRFTNRIKPGEQRTFAVLLHPFKTARPAISLKTLAPNQFLVGQASITFNDHSVDVQTR